MIGAYCRLYILLGHKVISDRLFAQDYMRDV